METMKMIAGLDIGNGYVKGTVQTEGHEPVIADYPSCTALNVGNQSVKSVTTENIKADVEDIFNRMEAVFITPIIKSTTVRDFGERGINSGNPIEEFDVNTSLSKVSDELSAVLVLGTLAGCALQEYYKENNELPKETLPVTVKCMALSLPITEYKNKRKEYAQMFEEHTHRVNIQNFEEDVCVEINIENVQVLAEGAAAQYAIVAHGPELMDAMLADLRAHGQKFEGLTAEDILNAENTIGIDIGEGTVNLPVFQNGKFNPDASTTFTNGYGTILERAREQLAEEYNYQFANRKAVEDFMQKPETRLTKARRNNINAVINLQIEGFIQELGIHLKKIFGRVGGSTEVLYVYGGGAAPLKDRLYPALIDMISNFGGGNDDYPILYLTAEYSRHLNREGLFLVAQQVAEEE